ncbi:hypothetical protein [Rhodococcus sp. P1Y]|uniref:hypothetical protein n=1 Tax=Rhodococcus sp. P1Y TaxID=1302308 RepID=UPI000EACAE66|nr:hypothetical protein [Rhodococcus sp. P1Y]AYJ50862.1 hypothetical protein D8W71_24140 [Rhodococcus sp. P1Y]
MSRRFSRLAGTVALSCAALLAVPATASADPAPVGVDAVSQAAAEAIASTRTEVAEPTDGNPLAALDAVNKILTDFGITPFFYPTAAVNCAAAPGAPLGIVPGVAGGAAGPWPNIAPIPGLPALNAVEKGETMFAFVPAGIVNDSGDKSGMQVAWFNVNTFQGGFADFGGATATLVDSVLNNLDVLPAVKDLVRGPLTEALNVLPAAGARAVPVETGTGTVLAAVFGTVNHKAVDGSDKSCFFFPTVGLVNVA